MKKTVIYLLMIVAMSLIPITAKAGWELKDGELVLTPDSYTEDGKIKVYNSFERIIPKPQLAMELPKIDISLPNMIFIGADNKIVEGSLSYPNREQIAPGFFDLQYIFTPNDDKYETISGYLHYEVWSEDSDISKGILPEPEPEETTTPSLTATTVQLETRTLYDINLNNKVTGSKYKWTSNNPDIAKVNAKNGLVTAVSEGETLVTCEITLPDETVQTLESLVIVGYDENAPLLTETILDLEVGDKFDLNLENKIQKSTYRWASSNRDIIKVNSSNGKVTATGVGKSYVTCTITTPENQVIVLKCDIIVTE